MKFTQDAAASPSDLRSNSAVQECDLGTKVVTKDGRAFRYVKAGGTTLVIGTLLDGPATVAHATNIAVAAAAAIGASSVTVTLGATAVVKNQYAGGVLVVNDEAGEGYTYTIKSHPAADASASLVVTLDDNETIKIALTTSSEVTLIPNQYNGVVIHAQSEAGASVGVCVYPITTLYYGWIQTRGPVSVLHDGSPAEIGEGISASTTTDGCVTELAAGLTAIGTSLVQGVSTEFNPVFLMID